MYVVADDVFDEKTHRNWKRDLKQFKSLFLAFITLISCNLSIQVV